MKEQRITIEIGHDGQISADTEGFSGDACVKELEKLLEGLAPGMATIDRKQDDGKALRTTTPKQTVGKKQ